MDTAMALPSGASEMERVRAEMTQLRERMDQAAVANARPALAGARPVAEAGAKAFVDNYLRKGVEGGVELKSFNGTTLDAGGYAVPREIDEMIDRALTGISPIRRVANVVKVGSAGYRKLVTTGGTPSGRVAETEPQTLARSSRQIARAVSRALDAAEG